MRRRSFLGLLAAPALRGQPERLTPDQPFAEAERAVALQMSKQSIPGLSVAAGDRAGIRWAAGFGLSDLENYVPARAVTVYRTASIAKPMTAVAALQLYERGKLDLDAPVESYVPAFPKKPWPVTTRQLLGHLGGIRHYKDTLEPLSTRRYRSTAEALSQFAADDLIAEPGTKYSYTTFGYVLAGAVVEAASGMPIDEYLRQNIFAPAQMTSTRTDTVQDLIPNRSRGYRRTADGRVLNCELADTSNKVAGGGLVSTAPDLVRFALAAVSGRLLRPASVDLMLTSLETRDGVATGYGLGWGVPVHHGKRLAVHGGGQAGVSTFVAAIPAEGKAVAIMCNLEGAQLNEIRDALLSA